MNKSTVRKTKIDRIAERLIAVVSEPIEIEPWGYSAICIKTKWIGSYDISEITKEFTQVMLCNGELVVGDLND